MAFSSDFGGKELRADLCIMEAVFHAPDSLTLELGYSSHTGDRILAHAALRLLLCGEGGDAYLDLLRKVAEVYGREELIGRISAVFGEALDAVNEQV